MSYSKLSHSAAKYIAQKTELDEEREQVIAYSIESLILSVIGFVSIVIVGVLLKAALPATVAALSGGILRRFSGGAHARTSFRCLSTGAVIYGGLIAVGAKYLAKFDVLNDGYLMICLAVCLGIVFRYAPVDCKAKRIRSAILRKRLKIGSICFVGVLILLVFSLDSSVIKVALALGALYQAFTLLPFFNKD